MSLPDRVVRRPVATITILLIVLIIGIVSLTQTPLDLLPEIKPPYLAVITVFPGSSPQETLALVTEPIEKMLAAIGGISSIQSLSQEHISLVALEFRWGADLKHLREDVSARLDLLSLPEGVQRPIILEFDPTLLPIMQVAASSGMSSVELTRWLEETAVPRLEMVPGVASVRVQGGAKQGLFIRLFPDLVQEKQVSFDQVAGILRASLLDLPGGIVEMDDRRMRIRIVGRPLDLETLAGLVVAFEMDEAALEAMLGREINVNLNEMLSGSMPPAGEIDIPMQSIYLKDIARNVSVDEEEGIITIHLNHELLEQAGITPEQLIDLLSPSAEAELVDGNIVITLPPDREIDWEGLRNTEVFSIPDFEKWQREMERTIDDELGRASEQIEKMLVDMAMAMIISSAGPGGGLPLPDDDFPLIPLRLSDIGEVKADLHTVGTINRINRQPSIGLAVQKEGQANTVTVSREIRRVLDELAEEPAGQEHRIQFNYTFDQASEIETALADLVQALLLGSLLAVAILLVFLRNWRTILIIGLTIPAGVIAAFALLYFARLTINLMTLGALALAAGMLVDNAIVVSENVYRHLQKGAGPKEAAVEGAKEVTGAIVASTLTTLSVFFPVVFLGGLAGEIFREFALTVSCALLASLVIALTVIPLLSSRFLGLNSGRKPGIFQAEDPRYRTILEKVLKYPWAVLGGGALAALAGLAICTVLGINLFPTPQESSFSINIHLPEGTTLSRTDNYVAGLEDIIERQEGVELFATRIGDAQMFGLPMEAGVSNQARVRVIIDPRHADRIDAIVEDIREQAGMLPGEANLHFQRESLLDASGLDIRLEMVIQGPDQKTINRLSAEVAEVLRDLPNLTDVQVAAEDSRPEIHIHIDHFEALRKGVTVYHVATLLHQAMEGVSVARLETEDGVFDLILGYRQSDIEGIEDLENIGFYTSGGYLRLGDVATLSESLGPLNIARQDQQVIGWVTAHYQGQDLGSASREAMAAVQAIELPPGYTIKEAASSQLGDVFGDLYLVLFVAAALVYLVMAAQFESFKNPFIIICSLPLALTGSALALLITGNSLSIPAMIGAVVLAGILVNDGIIMVDFINQQRFLHGRPLRQAIIEGASARLRPILMTTITTILGLVPLALGLGEGSQLQAPMAIVIIGGQITGTLLLLIVIPSIYLLINRRGLKVEMKKVGNENTAAGPDA